MNPYPNKPSHSPPACCKCRLTYAAPEKRPARSWLTFLILLLLGLTSVLLGLATTLFAAPG